MLWNVNYSGVKIDQKFVWQERRLIPIWVPSIFHTILSEYRAADDGKLNICPSPRSYSYFCCYTPPWASQSIAQIIEPLKFWKHFFEDRESIFYFATFLVSSKNGSKNQKEIVWKSQKGLIFHKFSCLFTFTKVVSAVCLH